MKQSISRHKYIIASVISTILIGALLGLIAAHISLKLEDIPSTKETELKTVFTKPAKKNSNSVKKDDFVCPENYEDSQQSAEGSFIYLASHKDLTMEEQKKNRHDDLVAHGCEWALFNMHTNSVLDETIKFNGKEFGPYSPEVYNETEVRTVFYPLKGQEAGLADEEIFFNFYIQEVWGDKPFTAEYVASLLAADNEERNVKTLYKFEAPDSLTGERAFFILADISLDDGEKSILVSKVTTLGEDIYSASYRKILGKKKQNMQILDWWEKNLNNVYKFFDLKLPSDSLGGVFNKERNTHRQIKHQNQ